MKTQNTSYAYKNTQKWPMKFLVMHSSTKALTWNNIHKPITPHFMSSQKLSQGDKYLRLGMQPKIEFMSYGIQGSGLLPPLCH